VKCQEKRVKRNESVVGNKTSGGSLPSGSPARIVDKRKSPQKRSLGWRGELHGRWGGGGRRKFEGGIIADGTSILILIIKGVKKKMGCYTQNRSKR